MEWFLYGRDLRHERVKSTYVLLIRERRRQLYTFNVDFDRIK